MTKSTARVKIKLQGVNAWEDLKRAQEHLLGIAAIADDRSDFIDTNLPPIMRGLQAVMDAAEKFMEGL